MNAPDLNTLLAKFKGYNPDQDTSLIEKAYQFAQRSKTRKRGTVFFTLLPCSQYLNGF